MTSHSGSTTSHRPANTSNNTPKCAVESATRPRKRRQYTEQGRDSIEGEAESRITTRFESTLVLPAHATGPSQTVTIPERRSPYQSFDSSFSSLHIAISNFRNPGRTFSASLLSCLNQISHQLGLYLGQTGYCSKNSGPQKVRSDNPSEPVPLQVKQAEPLVLCTNSIIAVRKSDSYVVKTQQ